MLRSEANRLLEEFRSLRAEVSLIGGRASREDVHLRERLWEICGRLREDIELFGPAEKEEILSLEHKSVFSTPLLKSLHRSISRSRSRSVKRRLEESSFGSASFQSAGTANMTTDSLASLMEAKLEMEEEMEELQAEQRRKVEELEREQRKKERERKRALIARAAASGVNVEALGLVEDGASRSFVSSSLNSGATAATATPTSADDITRLIGSQRVRAATIRSEDKFAGGEEEFPHFRAKLQADVLDVMGATPEEKFNGLIDRVKGEAKSVVDNFIYISDKKKALDEALKELQFLYGKRTGRAQATLKKVMAGKEVSANSAEQVKELFLELQRMVTFARASKDDSFLAMDATIVGIVQERFAHKMKGEFSTQSQKAEDRGETIDVDFVISFLKEWYAKLNRRFGMGSLLKEKPASASTSASSSFSHSASSAGTSHATSPSPRSVKPKGGNAPSSKPPAKAAVAAADAFFPRASFTSGYPRQSSWASPQSQWASPRQSWGATRASWSAPRQWSNQGWPRQAPRHQWGATSGFSAPSWGSPASGAVSERCVMCNDSHILVDCPAFAKLPVEQRRSMIWADRRCYRCGEADHRAVNCVAKVNACNSCGLMAHHSLLHPTTLDGADRAGVSQFSHVGTDQTAAKLMQLSGTASTAPASGAGAAPNVSVSAVSDGEGMKVYRPILPVRVEFEDGKDAFTYALLDSGSNKTVMTKDFCERVRCPMKSRIITLNGLGVSTSEKRKVGCIVIRSLEDDNRYSEAEAVVVDAIPVSGDQVARQSDVDGHDYLEDVVLRDLGHKEVGLLIGTDCAFSFSPLEVRHPKKKGPTAWRTPYGWCL